MLDTLTKIASRWFGFNSFKPQGDSRLDNVDVTKVNLHGALAAAYHAGLTQGHEEGGAQGYAQGYEEGYEEGNAEGSYTGDM